MGYAEDPFRTGMIRTIEQIWDNEEHVVFAPACYNHCILMGEGFNSIQVEGISAQDQLLAWIGENKRLRAVSTCDGVNCQPTCPEMETGEHTFCSKNIYN